MPDSQTHSTYVIRNIRRDELPMILDVQQNAYAPHLLEHLATFERRYEMYSAGFMGAFHSEQLAGYSISFPWYSDVPIALDQPESDGSRLFDCYYMHDVAVMPEHRGHGIADKFVNNCFDDARHHGLGTIRMVTVQGGQHIWSRYGFAIDGLAHESYGADAYKMFLHLNP